MLGMKINKNYQLYLNLCQVLQIEPSETGPSGLNNTFVVVVPDPKAPKGQNLEYWQEKDFRLRYKFEGDVDRESLTKVVRLEVTEETEE